MNAFVDQIVVDGGHLETWDTRGHGTPVLFLHPGRGNAALWRPQMERANGRRFIAYSRRGHGASSAAWGIPADDVFDLLDRLNIENAHLVGAAGGGTVALDAALDNPRRVASLTLAGTVVKFEDPAWQKSVEGMHVPIGPEARAEVQELGPSYRADNVRGIEEWLAIVENNATGIASTRLPVTRHAVSRKALQSLSMPVLLMAGGADLMMPPPLFFRLARWISNVGIAQLHDAGHAMAWEQPDQFTRALVEFIASAESANTTETQGERRAQ